MHCSSAIGFGEGVMLVLAVSMIMMMITILFNMKGETLCAHFWFSLPLKLFKYL